MGTERTLSSAWDQHLDSEFAAKSADQALATMTAEPYVNEVPLMIGARGRSELRDFYANHFLSQIPPDMEIVTVSRTIGQGFRRGAMWDPRGLQPFQSLAVTCSFPPSTQY